ncbi:hypothetical protein BXU11_05085 [Flavobacterium sp. LM5]|uniref:type II toxin-antitoxin system RelE/ParE family toxin n=1 Tax=Flavobacterium sp. LM5 TaxID=1938610 RepID=UPI000991F0CA|nr:type II toxin-antitoxin system RelE/ParE family toxin [Flavobacterium sp. LM5]OOV29294.1 hypothetical protein BXU11_05085 [Flavobacterium sp. LM5]
MIAILWTNRARNDYWQNISYLEEKWTLKEVYHFMDKVEAFLDLLANGNLAFKTTNYKFVYEVPVTKHVSLFYKVASDNSIELLRFWNSYQDPEKFTL